jgi:hypothetical protein
MQWIPINSKRLRQAYYDAERKILVVRMKDGSTRKHLGVLPNMVANLTSDADSDFYYRYYIEPCLVSERPAALPIVARFIKFGMVTMASLLMSAAVL